MWAPRRAARRRALPAAIGLAAMLAAAAACTSPAGGAMKPAAAAFSASGLAHAKSKVAEFEGPTSTYPIRLQKLPGIAALRGKTVYYVPIAQHTPQFVTTAAALKQALAVAGLSLRVCDGGSNPSQVSACITRAATARPGAIITGFARPRR